MNRKILLLACSMAFLATWSTAAMSAKVVEVDEAAVPDWPQGLGRDIYKTDQFRRGEVTIDFVAGPDGWVYFAAAPAMAAPAKYGQKVERALEEDFDKVSANAMYEWSFRLPEDLCGVLRGKQVYTFDGGNEEFSNLGATSAAISDEAIGVDQVLPPMTLGYTQTGSKLRDSRGGYLVTQDMYRVGPRGPYRPLPARRTPAAGFEPARLDAGSIAGFVAEHNVLPESKKTTRRSASLMSDNRPKETEPGSLLIATFTVSADGTVNEVSQHAAFGDPQFHTSALRALTGARFAPAKRDGQGVAVRACQAIGKVKHRAAE